MAKGYLIAHVKVTNEAAFKKHYSAKVVEVLSQYGGKFLVVTDQALHHEGRPCDRHVVVEFDSLAADETAIQSKEYLALKAHRVNNSDIDYGSFMLVPGV